MTVIGAKQAEAYIRKYGGDVMSNNSNQTYRLDDKRYANTGTIRVRVPNDDNRIIDVDADVVNANVSLLICLDTLKGL